MLLNLVGNGIADTDAGEVGLDVSASGDTFTLAVRDTGPGIAQGEVTLGLLSCAGRADYAVLGPVMDLAGALGAAAPPGQILLSPAVGAAVAGVVDVAPTAPVTLGGGLDAGASCGCETATHRAMAEGPRWGQGHAPCGSRKPTCVDRLDFRSSRLHG